MKPSKLRIFERRSPVKVLGPYARAVIWVQGCDFGCKGCIVPESWDRDTGEEVDISELVTWVLNQPGTSINCHLAAFKRLEPLRSRCHSQKNLYFSRYPINRGARLTLRCCCVLGADLG